MPLDGCVAVPSVIVIDVIDVIDAIRTRPAITRLPAGAIAPPARGDVTALSGLWTLTVIAGLGRKKSRPSAV